MDRLGAIRVFIAVADSGSLSGAGRRLSMPLSTVSRHLAALETDLGLRLVTRTTRRLALTEAGRAYLNVCRQVLDELEAAERRLAGEQDEPQGELGLTAPIVFGRLHVLPVVNEFLATFARMRVRMLLVDRVVDLIEEDLDIAIRIGTLPDSALIATRLGAIRYVTCASPTYLSARGIPSVPLDLMNHDCIGFSAISTTERWNYSSGKRQQQVKVQPRLVVNTAEAAMDAAVAGLGIARVFSYQGAAGLRRGALTLILEDYEPSEIPVSLVHIENRLPQAKVQSFISFAVRRLRGRLDSL